MNRKALSELAAPHDDGKEWVQITKADLRSLLGQCQLCAFIVGGIIGAFLMQLITIAAEAIHGG